MSKYLYNVRLGRSCGLLTAPAMANVIKNAGEMILTSKYYSAADECLSELEKLMSRLCELSNEVSERQFVVVTKIKDVDNVEFKEFQVALVYVVDEELLKEKNELHFVISAHVSISKLV